MATKKHRRNLEWEINLAAAATGGAAKLRTALYAAKAGRVKPQDVAAGRLEQLLKERAGRKEVRYRGNGRTATHAEPTRAEGGQEGQLEYDVCV